PGHGSSRADSHKGFVDITRYWQPEELTPYRNLIAGGMADMVMRAHLYHEKFSGNSGKQLPASLSPNWITGVLRSQLGYSGVVISDDMEMGAIRQQFSLEESIVLAVRAGTDILLFANTARYRAGLAGEIVDVLVRTARDDPAFRARIEESYARIVALKSQLAR
ncbi:MAG TPA: glycoside hydrolase family 3, partial [Devosia sp.]|nr:glycoside hydrolase family 3 [Devosia sp.]